MSNVICYTQIVDIGQHAKNFYQEKMLITFKEGISSELFDYCIILANDLSLTNTFTVNNILTIGTLSYTITAVGSEVIKNFENLGHMTIIFDGENQARLDGAIHVSGELPKQLSIHDTFLIEQ
ncbi:PTS glucitol/sorbitol transporter subunit IIA [Orbus mooreae]|uniref:PTS glucitol/sorbitol transporter subunit IIA n=1 Tax=Orbus mooreae TaxID=3074107 RepID=UPI00370D83DC